MANQAFVIVPLFRLVVGKQNPVKPKLSSVFFSILKTEVSSVSLAVFAGQPTLLISFVCFVCFLSVFCFVFHGSEKALRTVAGDQKIPLPSFLP